MIRNYLVAGFRAQKRQKWYTVLNILGLTIGIATALFIFSYVREDFRWDRFTEKGDRLYRLIQIQTFNTENENHTPFTMPAIGPSMMEKIVGVETFVRTTGMWKCSLSLNDKAFAENFRYVDSNLFEIFDYPLLYGDRKTVLTRPESIVLPVNVAKKFFGEENAVGKKLVFEGKRELTVTGVMGKPETETHLEQNVILPLESMHLDAEWMSPDQLNSWHWFNFFTYVLLEEGADIKVVNAQLPAFFEEHYDPSDQRFYLHPFFDVHLKSHQGINSSGTNSNYATVLSLIAIAIFILIIACINFINMSTAQSMKRAREVGMRKVAGATRRGLIVQFLTESIMISFFAMILAAVITEVGEPWLTDIFGRVVHIDVLDFGFTTLSLLGLTLTTGILSGLYPAFVISRPLPVQILKGGLASHKAPWVRRGLVVLQFTISIILLISTAIIYKQVHYLKNKNLGYNKEGIFLLYMNNDNFVQNLDDNLAKIEDIPGVEYTTCCNKFPGRLGNIRSVLVEGNPDYIMVHDMVVTPGFEKVFQCELAEGRFLDKKLVTDRIEGGSGSVIINETAMKVFGWEEALGKTIDFRDNKMNVVGVVKDFHFVSLHQSIEPMVIVTEEDWLVWTAIRFNTDNTEAMVKSIERIWHDVAPDSPYQYMFMDEFYDSLYRSETQQAKVFNIFSGIAIFIACLGLLGLAAYATNTRSREISVRKVLGASVRQILLLLGREYFWMVLIASLIASPIAYFLMNKWLDSFSYTTAMSYWVFLSVGIAVLFIAGITVAGQAIKAAMRNPAKALRHE